MINLKANIPQSLMCIAAAISIAGCTSSKSEIKTQEPMAKPVTVGGQKIGEMTVNTVDAETLRKNLERLSASGLSTVPTHKSLNANVFKIEGISDRPQYYVAPRLIVYGGGSFGALEQEADGRYTVPFNVAIIDGLSKNTNSMKMDGTEIEIPSAFRVSDYEELKENVRSVTGTSNPFEIAALPGCAEEIKMNFAGRSFDATPENTQGSDYCEINKPFIVTVRLTEKELHYALTDALRNSLADINVKYSVVVPVPVAELHVNFSKRKIFEAIKIRLIAQYPPYAQMEVENAIQSVIKESEMNIYIKGDYNSQMQKIVSQAVEQFFVKFEENPKVDLDQKCVSVACVQFKQANYSDEEMFQVNWVQMDNQRIQRTVSFGSKLHRADDITSFTGVDPSRPETLKAEPFTNVVKNKMTNPNNVFYAGFIPRYGSRIIVNPTVYQWENRAAEEYVVATRNWEDCTGRNSWGQCSYTTRTARTFSKSKTGEQAWQTIQNPIGKVGRLFADLDVVVEFTNNRVVRCPLENLAVDQNAGGVEIRISDVEGCESFRQGKIVRYGLVNRIQLDPVTYTAGQRYHDGARNESKSYFEDSYIPEVRLGVQQTLINTMIRTIEPLVM
ncbi:hypothetical protein [Bdellovibrio sp. HCB274]|uniref:hypothetical protein n=1 Tax=Bdellovibrio sp. HCB274 TaxID=3394361 RepID=UPI0039B64EB0